MQQNYAPLLFDEKNTLYTLSHEQIDLVDTLRKKINKQEYVLIENHCLCGNKDTQFDFIIAQNDRYGIPIKSALCEKCGLIRSTTIFDEKSSILFYENEYRPLYTRNLFTNKTPSIQEVFDGHKKKGTLFVNLLKRLKLLSSIKNVHEIGCACGGILKTFQEEECLVTGYDFNKKYLNFGNKKGVPITYGKNKTDKNFDLIILSHVLEHLNNPIASINTFASKIAANKFILIEVPGFFWEPSGYTSYPILSIQNAHVFQFFYQYYLEALFLKLGLTVIYGDETCTFILQKPSNWKPLNFTHFYDKEMKKWAKKIKILFLKKVTKYDERCRLHSCKSG